MSKFDLAKDVPHIHNTIELKRWLRPLYIIDDILTSYDNYYQVLEEFMNLLRASYVIHQCREFPIKFKFYRKDKKYYTLQLRHFAINLIIWAPFVELHELDVLNEEFILDCENDVPTIEDYINYKLIVVLREYHVKSTIINYRISDVLYNLRKISIDFSMIMGLNFSIMTFIEMYQKNEEIRDIMEVTFDKNLQPHEIEQQLEELSNREIEIYRNEKDNPIGVILRAKTGVKYKQFTEFTSSEGLKPTLEGVTIPIPIENSTLLRGLDRPSYLYIDATGSRKSLVMNKKVMGKAGYFGKIVLLLARTLSMSTKISDCGTKHLVEYEVKTKKHLSKLNGKFYKENLNEYDYKLLNEKKDKKLIGKKIYVRSAAKCALGDCVCPKCVGLTASTNYDIADGLGAFDSEEVTKVINQGILSTKHLLKTNSEIIEFNPEFYKFFTMIGGEINPIVNNNEEVYDIENYAIYIHPDDIIKMNEQDYDSLFNTCIGNGRFFIVDITKKDSMILMQPKEEKEMFLTEEAIELMKKGKGYIYFKDMDDDTKLFEMQILNKELTKPLYDLMNLLNKQNKDNIEETIDTISQKMLDLLIESGIDANAIAGELIINRLIRSVDRIYERPNFYKKELEPYEIYTVSRALEKNGSPLIGLSFQNIRRQLLSNELYGERNKESFIDPFYWTDIPTDNLKKYDAIVKTLETDDEF